MKAKFVYVFLAFLMVGSLFTMSAQKPVNKDRKQHFTPEQITEKQTNQMIKNLMLDDATAAKFTPVYQNYLKALRECRMMNHKHKMMGAEAPKAGGQQEAKPLLTDAQVEQQIKENFAQSRKILDVREKYYNEFRKILSPKQILKIYQTEKSNANKLRKEFDRRKGQKPAQGKHKHPVRPNTQPQK